MWRIGVVAVLAAIGIWLAIDAVITTDAERVEAEIERLLDVARQGGESAATEILGALSDDYRGAGTYSRERIAGYLRVCVAGGPAEEIWTGDYIAVPKEDGVVVPLLRLHVRTKEFEGDTIVKVTFAERDGRFRILNVERWGPER